MLWAHLWLGRTQTQTHLTGTTQAHTYANWSASGLLTGSPWCLFPIIGFANKSTHRGRIRDRKRIAHSRWYSTHCTIDARITTQHHHHHSRRQLYGIRPFISPDHNLYMCRAMCTKRTHPRRTYVYRTHRPRIDLCGGFGAGAVDQTRIGQIYKALA